MDFDIDFDVSVFSQNETTLTQSIFNLFPIQSQILISLLNRIILKPSDLI